MLATVCGIEPAAPGFGRVRIAPHPGSLERIEAGMPHPRGMIHCRLVRGAGHRISARLELPEGLEGEFVWRGEKVELTSGVQEISLPAEEEQ